MASFVRKIRLFQFFVTLYVLWTMLQCAIAVHKRSKLIDLTHSFDNNTLRIPPISPFKIDIKHLSGGTTALKFRYQIEDYSSDTHVGTHLDAPCHFETGQWTVTDIPLERLIRDAVVVDISSEIGNNPAFQLTPRHFAKWESTFGRIPDGSILLIKFGWSRFWRDDPEKYIGITNGNRSNLLIPSLSNDAAVWLMTHRNVVGIGSDTISLDSNLDIPLNHLRLLSGNIFLLENLKMLEHLPPVGTTLYVMPMKIKDACGAPARVVAKVP